MSLETEIKALTLAINTLRETIAGQSAPNDAPVQPAPVAPAPVAQVAPAIVVAPAMPPVPFPGAGAAPTFTAPAPVVPPMPSIAPESAVAPGRPFNDVAGATTWVISRYNALGARGSEIQKVLAALGITNIQETKPEQFDALFTQVSALG